MVFVTGKKIAGPAARVGHRPTAAILHIYEIAARCDVYTVHSKSVNELGQTRKRIDSRKFEIAIFFLHLPSRIGIKSRMSIRIEEKKKRLVSGDLIFRFEMKLQ